MPSGECDSLERLRNRNILRSVMPDNSTKFDLNSPVKIPEWINEKYFEKILLSDVENFEKILKFTPIPATAPGENYASIMVRVLMDIKLKDGFTEQKSYIIKTMLDDERGGAFVNALNMFPKERSMYESIIPQLELLYHEIGKDVKFAPKCHWIEDKQGRITIVLDDLHTKKFKNINRLKGFDMAHMTRVLEKLAEFHAASAVFVERNGPLPQSFLKSYIPANYHKSKTFQLRVDGYKAAMATWGLEDHEKYAAKLPTTEQYVNSLMGCCTTDPNEFMVLCHGDFWSSNIMQNYTPNGDIKQTRFVDFQMSKWSSPAMDLWELIICSSASNSRIREFDHFVRIYHTHLLRCLRVLKYSKPVPKLRELHISMLKYGFWGFFTTFSHLVLILLPADKEASLTKLLQPNEDGEKFRTKAFTNPVYVRAVLDIFPFLYRRGLLDF